MRFDGLPSKFNQFKSFRPRDFKMLSNRLGTWNCLPTSTCIARHPQATDFLASVLNYMPRIPSCPKCLHAHVLYMPWLLTCLPFFISLRYSHFFTYLPFYTYLTCHFLRAFIFIRALRALIILRALRAFLFLRAPIFYLRASAFLIYIHIFYLSSFFYVYVHDS